jgi:uncharacterized protein (DUF2267 family)
MSHHEVSAFKSTIQTTHIWLNELMEHLAWMDPERAYHALSAVLRALRDRLPVDAVAALGAQLPLLIRGAYYEGWHPSGTPLKERKREEFLGHIRGTFPSDFEAEPEEVARAVFQVLMKHVSDGEIEKVKNALPFAIRSLWSEDTHTLWS